MAVCNRQNKKHGGKSNTECIDPLPCFFFGGKSKTKSIAVIGRQPLAVKMRIVGKLKNLRIHDSLLIREFDHGHTSMEKIKPRRKNRIRNIQQIAQKRPAKTDIKSNIMFLPRANLRYVVRYLRF